MADYIPQVDYTSRDYEAIRSDMLGLIPNFSPAWSATDPSDFGVVLVELFAYMGDMLNYYIDRAANENFLQSATQPDTVIKLARLYGYTPYSTSPSTATVTLKNSSTSAITVPAKTVLSAGTDADGNTIYFETDSAVSFLANNANATKTVAVTQGRTIYAESVGESTGLADQEFTLDNQKVDLTSISVSVGNKLYTRVDNLLYYSSSDYVFYASSDSDGNVTLTFGDGVSGAIPPKGGLIAASYRTCLGESGNISSGSISSIIDVIDPSISITASTEASGGTDDETAESVRVNAPLFLQSGNRAVSIVDYQNLALSVPDISKVRAVSQYFTQVILFVSTANFGTTTTAQKTSIINTLTNKVPPNTTIQVVDRTLSYPQIKLTVNALPNYNVANVSTAVKQKLLDLFSFDNVSFGQRITSGLIYGAINRGSVEGLDYITINGLTTSNTAPSVQLTDVTNNADIFLAANEIPYLSTLNLVLVNGTGIS